MQKKILPFELFLSDVMLIRENDNMFFFFVAIATSRLLTGNDCGISWDKKKKQQLKTRLISMRCTVV